MSQDSLLRPIVVALLVVVLWPTRAVAQPPIFRCTDGVGLCQWIDGAWKTYWRAETTESLVDFRVEDHRVVVLLRGHMAPGRLLLLDEEGKGVLIQDLATGRPLAAVVGNAPGNLLVLCNGYLGSALCDTWVPSEPSTRTLFPPPIPDNCLYPRFLGGSLSCIQPDPQPVLRVGSSRPLSGAFSRIPLSFEGAGWIEDLHPLRGGQFLILVDGKVFLVDRAGESRLVSEGEVDWSAKVEADRVVFPQCWLRDDLTLEKCVLSSFDLGLGLRVLWSSDHFWPIELAVQDDETYLVQLASEDEHALLRLETEKAKPVSQLVWRAPKDPSASTEQALPLTSPLLLIGEWVNFAGYEISFYEDGRIVYWHNGEATISNLAPEETSDLKGFLDSEQFAEAKRLLRTRDVRSAGNEMHEVGFVYAGESFGYSIAQGSCKKRVIDDPVAQLIELVNTLAGSHFTDLRRDPIPRVVCD